MARSPPTPCRSVLGRVSLINLSLLRQKKQSSRRYSPRPEASLKVHVYLPPICRISQKRLNNATPCVNMYTPRPVGLLHDAFQRGQSAVLLTISAQLLDFGAKRSISYRGHCNNLASSCNEIPDYGPNGASTDSVDRGAVDEAVWRPEPGPALPRAPPAPRPAANSPPYPAPRGQPSP